MSAKKAVEKAAETVWIEALEPILHDGERIAVGALREIEKLAAEALVKLGGARLASPPATADKSTPETPASAAK